MESTELDEALKVARRLARKAQKAGLVVTQLAPHRCQGRYGCHLIQFWGADGRLWAEASHESTQSVRDHIAGYRAHVRGNRRRRSGGG